MRNKNNRIVKDIQLELYKEFIITNHGKEVLNRLNKELMVELTNSILEIPEQQDFNNNRIEYR